MSEMLMVKRYIIYKDDYELALEPDDEYNPDCRVWVLLPKKGDLTVYEAYDIVSEIFREQKDTEGIWVNLNPIGSILIEYNTSKDDFFKEVLEKIRLCDSCE